MFNYTQDFKTLKTLRSKIFNKQRDLLNLMYENKLNFQDPSLKSYINEINLLEEILDIRTNNFLNDSKNFWKE